jgi:tryptophan synthase alpha chain
VTIESQFRAARDAGRKLLVPYVTGGYGADWTEIVTALASAGADAIELGIPFSDPIMDGPVIQEATRLALEQGATPASVVAAVGDLDIDVPIVAMTSYNICFRAGHERFARTLCDHRVAGVILPDLPVDELDTGDPSWADAADAAGVETILLAAPTTPDDRLEVICARTRGWVYGVGTLGVTGERSSLASSASVIAKRLKTHTDKPVLIGIGVSTPDQASDVCAEADGVIVGSALVRRILAGSGPDGAADFVGSLRAAIDAG